MVTFTEKDFNLTKIRRESKLFNLATRRTYHVYGLKQSGNAPILIEYNQYDSSLSPLVEQVKKFFSDNNIAVEIEDDCDSDVGTFSIGLRRDVRKQIVLSAAILQTIVYALEERLTLVDKPKLKGIPKFTSNSLVET